MAVPPQQRPPRVRQCRLPRVVGVARVSGDSFWAKPVSRLATSERDTYIPAPCAPGRTRTRDSLERGELDEWRSHRAGRGRPPRSAITTLARHRTFRTPPHPARRGTVVPPQPALWSGALVAAPRALCAPGSASSRCPCKAWNTATRGALQGPSTAASTLARPLFCPRVCCVWPTRQPPPRGGPLLPLQTPQRCGICGSSASTAMSTTSASSWRGTRAST